MSLKHIDEILIHHLTAFGNNDLDEILKDYTEDSKVFTPSGLLEDLKSIRAFFEAFFAAIPAGSKFEMKQKTIVNHVAYIAWSSESPDIKIPIGTDTFVFENGKIKYHTVADYRIEK
jgi:ketosteroid isomerase-like protein